MGEFCPWCQKDRSEMYSIDLCLVKPVEDNIWSNSGLCGPCLITRLKGVVAELQERFVDGE